MLNNTSRKQRNLKKILKQRIERDIFCSEEQEDRAFDKMKPRKDFCIFKKYLNNNTFSWFRSTAFKLYLKTSSGAPGQLIKDYSPPAAPTKLTIKGLTKEEAKRAKKDWLEECKEYRAKLEPLSYEKQLAQHPEAIIGNCEVVYERPEYLVASTLDHYKHKILQ